MTAVLQLRALIQEFVSGSNQTLENAGAIEVALDELFGDLEPFASVRLDLASYRPGGGKFLYDESAITPRLNHVLGLLDKRSE